MASSNALKGIELIDCAKANAKQGIETTAHLCGYGEDITTFSQELQQACQQIGVEIHELSDLITDQQMILQQQGIEVAPDSKADL
jgi:adenosine deaminase